jgi:xanthine/uracil/vitamin C permease (AzgA family)
MVGKAARGRRTASPAVRRLDGESKMKRRGLFLNIMILTLVVGDLQIPYYLFVNPDALKSVYTTLPSWYQAYALFGLALSFSVIVGMWRMQRWAVYPLAAYFGSKVIADFAYTLPSAQLMVLATTAVGAALWFWAIARKWSAFEPTRNELPPAVPTSGAQ